MPFKINLTPRHVVVVCEDPPFQKLAELALRTFAKQTIEFDERKIGKMEYKRPARLYATPGVRRYNVAASGWLRRG